MLIYNYMCWEISFNFLQYSGYTMNHLPFNSVSTVHFEHYIFLHFAHTVYVCILYDSQSKMPFFPYKASIYSCSVARDESVLLNAETSEIREYLKPFPWQSRDRNQKQFWKCKKKLSPETYYMAELFYKNWPKCRYQRLGLELRFIHKVLCCYQFILL
jgi:hypothetical protein